MKNMAHGVVPPSFIISARRISHPHQSFVISAHVVIVVALLLLSLVAENGWWWLVPRKICS